MSYKYHITIFLLLFERIIDFHAVERVHISTAMLTSTFAILAVSVYQLTVVFIYQCFH